MFRYGWVFQNSLYNIHPPHLLHHPPDHRAALFEEAKALYSAGGAAPLLERIEATDGLIDAIVYRLYGLSEDEIRIVEESISGEKTKESSKNKKID